MLDYYDAYALCLYVPFRCGTYSIDYFPEFKYRATSILLFLHDATPQYTLILKIMVVNSYRFLLYIHT